MSKGESYEEFVEKFEKKLTTDDCYTPQEIMAAVEEWVAEEYGVESWQFVRPFWPGEDFSKRQYRSHEVVVDNPPFSIITQITRWYRVNGVKFFLFAPALTILGASEGCCAIATGAGVTYENGAEVRTSFVTNLEDCRMRTAPGLYQKIEEANRKRVKQGKKELPKYIYPDSVVTAAMAQKWSRYGVQWSVGANDCVRIGALDSQRPQGKTIFGGGLLLSERAAAERAAAERAAAERAAATRWELSEREKEIQRGLEGGTRREQSRCSAGAQRDHRAAVADALGQDGAGSAP